MPAKPAHLGWQGNALQTVKIKSVRINLGNERSANFSANREAAVQAVSRWARQRGHSVRCADLDLVVLHGGRREPVSDMEATEQVLQELLGACMTTLEDLALAVPVYMGRQVMR